MNSADLFLNRSLKIWSLYADLEESMGTFRTAKAVYDAIIDLRIATPQIIMNYALFLEENNYFEESFKVSSKCFGNQNLVNCKLCCDVFLQDIKDLNKLDKVLG